MKQHYHALRLIVHCSRSLSLILHVHVFWSDVRRRKVWMQPYGENVRSAVRRQIGLLCWRVGIYSKTTHTHMDTHTHQFQGHSCVGRRPSAVFVATPSDQPVSYATNIESPDDAFAAAERKPELTGTIINRALTPDCGTPTVVIDGVNTATFFTSRYLTTTNHRHR